MPNVCEFFGIAIFMYFDEHPPAHFHARYGGERAVFSPSGDLLRGAIRSRTAVRLIREWAAMHEAEIIANWQRAEKGESLEKIAPLD